MARKKKGPPEKPSKAYLVSFGDTMTALLAFFIVLNSFAKEQTGANMYSGTGSFVHAMNNVGLPGGSPINASELVTQKKAASPLYCVENKNPTEKDPDNRFGPDKDPDKGRVIDRQTENFKRFLNDVSKEFDVNEEPPTQSQVVFDSFEKFRRPENGGDKLPLQQNGIRLASEAIMKLGRADFELEIVIWADMPAKVSMVKAVKIAAAVQDQIDKLFRLTEAQQKRLSVSAKPWLFADAARPKASFIISRLDLSDK